MEVIETKENIDVYEKEIWTKFWTKLNLQGNFKESNYKLIENNEMIGYVSTTYFAGVLHIREIIIDDEHRGNKRGHKILEFIDNLAKELNCHKLKLETSEEFMPNAYYLYRKFGYKKETTFVNDLFNRDWSIMTKFIKK